MLKIFVYRGGGGIEVLWECETAEELNAHCEELVKTDDPSAYYLMDEEDGKARNVRRLDYYIADKEI